jgi:hypothetical protein
MVRPVLQTQQAGGDGGCSPRVARNAVGPPEQSCESDERSPGSVRRLCRESISMPVPGSGRHGGRCRDDRSPNSGRQRQSAALREPTLLEIYEPPLRIREAAGPARVARYEEEIALGVDAGVFSLPRLTDRASQTVVDVATCGRRYANGQRATDGDCTARTGLDLTQESRERRRGPSARVHILI